MEKDTTYIGLDAHQETIHAAMLLPGAEQALTESFENTPEVIRRFVRRLRRRAPGEVVCCYKAGPLGFCLQRSLIRSRLFVRGRGSLADPGEAGGSDQDRPARCAEAGRAAAGGAAHGGPRTNGGALPRVPVGGTVGVMVYKSPGTSFTPKDALDGNEP